MNRTAEIKLTYRVVESALKSLFVDSIVVEQATEEQKRRDDIDFIVRDTKNEYTIDLKIRSGSHNLLVIETDVLNNEKRTAWLWRSRADYFLFAHVASDVVQFYLVARKDLLRLVKQKTPLARRAFVYSINDVSILYFYEYTALSTFGEFRSVTVDNENTKI